MQSIIENQTPSPEESAATPGFITSIGGKTTKTTTLQETSNNCLTFPPSCGNTIDETNHILFLIRVWGGEEERGGGGVAQRAIRINGDTIIVFLSKTLT